MFITRTFNINTSIDTKISGKAAKKANNCWLKAQKNISRETRSGSANERRATQPKSFKVLKQVHPDTDASSKAM
jgi:hypothetical protein